MRLLMRLVPVLLLASFVCAPCSAAEPAFLRTTIDLGMVVTDLDTSIRFYTEGIGFQETKGFEVSADVASGAGLTDSKPLKVRVLVLGEGDTATKLKLMQVPGTSPRTGDNEFIHSHTGFRYLTIIVADQKTALARLEKIGVKPLKQSPVAIPETTAPGGLFLTCVRDPDGNIVELVGPSASK